MSDLMEVDAPATSEPATRENSPTPAPVTMRKDPSVLASTSATARLNIKLDVVTYLNVNKRQLNCLPKVLCLVGFDTLVSTDLNMDPDRYCSGTGGMIPGRILVDISPLLPMVGSRR
jgi:hypothetical protein